MEVALQIQRWELDVTKLKICDGDVKLQEEGEVKSGRKVG
jgi:hypothetical protein